MIVVPVRMGDAWFLYQTTRSGSQTVMGLAKAFKSEVSRETKDAVTEFSSVLHTLGRGTMQIWLRMLQRDIAGQEPDAVQARKKAEQDEDRDEEDHGMRGYECLDSESMTPGTLGMHMLHEMLTAGTYHGDTLVEKYSFLMQGIKGGIPAADHSRQLMQLALAANKLVGDSFSKEVEAQLATGQQAEEPREAQSRKRPRPKGDQGERGRHTWGSRKDDT